MNQTHEILKRLADEPAWGYHAGDSAATEPTALVACALRAGGFDDAATRAAAWLAATQTSDGSIGVRAGEPEPNWPTSLAVLAWRMTDPVRFADSIARAIQRILSMHGEPVAQSAESGHDTTLVGWPWVAGTHSWVEPTALHVMALKATGYKSHPRVRSAVRLLNNRLLPDGGCNYGNTFVLGQMLRPHIQPTGLALVALADEPPGERQEKSRLTRSIKYLRQSLSAQTAAASLAWGVLALTAHGCRSAAAEDWLESAAQRTLRTGGSPHKLGLLALAALAPSDFLPPRTSHTRVDL